jgi:hypothetical protein
MMLCIYTRECTPLYSGGCPPGTWAGDDVETLGLARVRRILPRFEYACGYQDALTSGEMVHGSNLEER